MLTREGVRDACAVALVAAMSVITTFAQPADKRTLFTFSGPVAIPGVTLPAGQYLFRVPDSTANAKVVQVLSADGTKPYAMFFTYPAERLEAASQPEVRFMETAKDMPAAIKTWWYPGERTGYEFIYPKDQARRLAQSASQSVLTTQAQTTTAEQTNTSDLARVSSTGQDTNLNADTGPTASTPTGTTQSGAIASSSISIPNASVPAMAQTSGSRATGNAAGTAGQPTQATRTQLPQTASSLPLIRLVGLLAIFGAAAVYAWRHNRPMQGR